MTATGSVGTRVRVRGFGARRAAGPHRVGRATSALALGAAGITVVYGGGSRGLMGTMADAALDAGARVIGVVPRGLVRGRGGAPRPGRDRRGRRPARAQASDDRAQRRVPGAARRSRHPRRAGRGRDLGPTRPAREAGVLLDIDGYWDVRCWSGSTARWSTGGYVTTASRRLLQVVELSPTSSSTRSAIRPADGAGARSRPHQQDRHHDHPDREARSIPDPRDEWDEHHDAEDRA